MLCIYRWKTWDYQFCALTSQLNCHQVWTIVSSGTRSYINVYVQKQISKLRWFTNRNLPAAMGTLQLISFPAGPLQFSQYAEQQANEITVIHEFVENNSNCVLLGDFNHGPATPGLSWYLPLNYGLMTARGLLSISATFCGQCTSCSDNILTGGQLLDIHIDHIYIPANQISSVRRVMVCNIYCHVSGV